LKSLAGEKVKPIIEEKRMLSLQKMYDSEVFCKLMQVRKNWISGFYLN